MPPPATLTRVEFNQACQKLASKYKVTAQRRDENVYLGALGGWEWFEHKSVPAWGHLTRTTVSRLAKKSFDDEDTETFEDEELIEPDDESNNTSGAAPDTSNLYVHESIAWHPTAFQNAGIEVFGATVQPKENNYAQFPLLSQGDHPILGTPHWYFHPCETSTAVTELLSQMPDVQWDQSSPDHPLRWLETWFTVLSTAIDLT
ncbi:hypothetical protein FRC07_004003 [Ceratobasidium sp. 392]|nr:hypothetical protein FRC07_004003 [Ceratobasidium sp. 392]